MIGKHMRDDELPTEAVRVDTDDVARGVTRGHVADGVGLGEARRRFGGFDLPAALAGMLAALGLTVLLAGLAGAAGSVGYQRGADAADLSSGGLVTGLVVLLAAFFVGGWVAGRMARYDGVLNGMACALLFVLLAAGVSAAGAWLGERYDFFDDVNLPQWFTDTGEAAAMTSAIIGIVVMVVAAALGGAVGTRYHRRADAVIATTRPDALGDEGSVVDAADGEVVHDGTTTQLDHSGTPAGRAGR